MGFHGDVMGFTGIWLANLANKSPTTLGFMLHMYVVEGGTTLYPEKDCPHYQIFGIHSWDRMAGIFILIIPLC